MRETGKTFRIVLSSLNDQADLEETFIPFLSKMKKLGCTKGYFSFSRPFDVDLFRKLLCHALLVGHDIEVVSILDSCKACYELDKYLQLYENSVLGRIKIGNLKKEQINRIFC